MTKTGLAFMVRLGMWGQGIKFTTFQGFLLQDGDLLILGKFFVI
jgi:hypothetical protein